MRVTRGQLECFVAVCDEGRMTAAAERVVEAGTHAALFGTVVEARAGEAPALLDSRRPYGRPALVAAR